MYEDKRLQTPYQTFGAVENVLRCEDKYCLQSTICLKRKGGLRRIPFLCVFFVFLLLMAGCSALPARSANSENQNRFALAEQHGQFVAVNRSVDCKGTKVTIEKILLDKPHTFMIAAVDGEIKGTGDYLTADLFGDQDQELGRSTFSQKLPSGKTLLTFDALEAAPAALRLEFFGGPVGYGGNVSLTLKDIDFKTVEGNYSQEYRLNETLERKGYRLTVDSIGKGISETGLHFQLTALGNYDGIEHGWLSDYWHKSYPQTLFLSANGRNLEPHLSEIVGIGPSYRISRDMKTRVGRAYFDGLTSNTLQVRLTDIYGTYSLNEIIPLDGVKDKLDINRKLSLANYSVDLKSFTRGRDKGTWVLNYRVLDSTGQPVDGAIDAGIYKKADNYKIPCPLLIDGSSKPLGQDQMLIFTGEPPAGQDGFLGDAALKITRLGIRQEDAVLNIDLDNPSKPSADRDKTEIMAAVQDYYTTFGEALKSNDLTVLTRKYGYLLPTGQDRDGVNNWRQDFQVWSPLKIKEYAVSFNDPILTVTGNTATADIAGQEKIVRSEGKSGSVFNTVFSLAKEEGNWKIRKVDELTDAERDE
ncbi:hypothetical protein REC12_25830 [Desulfosporosinus sp. PR]|uniref:hypothetical protein n=1 Tax=Candidatus Desulfosporosinus nitrosoreducens TaxID=3401928 RepID=UPI0027FD3E5E|nr:hypothetical protein [Desulfosporosinus sp. PR]MDQ7097019.1 hypothetical protein [Desulfosporosinus sp. PR]